MSLFLSLLVALMSAGGDGQLAPPVNPYPDIRLDFALEDGYIPLNHGSYGTVPIYVTEKTNELVRRAHSNPDRWFRHQYRPLVNSTRQLIADHVGADMDDVVLVDNASDGCNAILRSLLRTGDGVIFYPHTYYMVKNVINMLVATRGVVAHVVNISFPVLSDEEYIAPVSNYLSSGAVNPATIKLCVFSHISSMPSFVEPVADLVALCHSYGIDVLLDGAHTVGQIPLNLTEIGAEYYVSNMHKWLFAPTGSAFLHVKRDRQHLIMPTVLSVEHTQPFALRFEYQGTRDYTTFIGAAVGLEYVDLFLGGEAAQMTYNHDLALWASLFLFQQWNTSLISPNDPFVANMFNIELPFVSTMDEALLLRDTVFSTYGYYFVYDQYLYSGNDRVWARISTQVYLDPTDFEGFAAAVLSVGRTLFAH